MSDREYLERANNTIQSILEDLREVSGMNPERIGEWLNGYALDVRYLLDSNFELIEVGLLVSFGGPTVWVWTDGDSVRIEYYEAFYTPVVRHFKVDLTYLFDYFVDLVDSVVVR